MGQVNKFLLIGAGVGVAALLSRAESSTILPDYEYPIATGDVDPMTGAEYREGETGPDGERNLYALMETIFRFESGNRPNVYCDSSIFHDLSDHPIATGEKAYIKGPSGPTSAAGLAQITFRTWRDLGGRAKYGDFSETAQRAAAVDLIKRRGAIPYIVAGDFRGAANALRDEFEIFKKVAYDDLARYYLSQGGVIV